MIKTEGLLAIKDVFNFADCVKLIHSLKNGCTVLVYVVNHVSCEKCGRRSCFKEETGPSQQSAVVKLVQKSENIF